MNASLHLDLNKLCNLSDKDDEVKLVLEVICSSIDVKALSWLLACLDEVVNNLRLNLELVFENGAEKGNGEEAVGMGIKAYKLTHGLLHKLKRTERLRLLEVGRWKGEQGRIVYTV